MILKTLLDGRFTCANLAPSNGEIIYWSDVQDWGFSVKDLQICFLLLGRSSLKASIRVLLQTGFTPDINALKSQTDPIALVATSSPPFPTQTPTTVASFSSPYFRLGLGVQWNTVQGEESVTALLIAGGKAY